MKCTNFLQTYIKGLYSTINAVKIAILKEDERLFNMLDIEDDNIFLEPFIYLYYASGKKEIMLWQILFGYIRKDKISNDLYFKAFADSNGIVYFPKIGYFKIDSVSNGEIDVEYQYKTRNIVLADNKSVLNYTFSPVISTADSNVEIYPFHHDLFNISFDRFSKSTRVDGKKYNNFTKSLIRENTDKINWAYEFLVNSNYTYFQLVIKSLKGIHNFKSKEFWSFSDRLSYGISFLSGYSSDSVIFFLVELAHQIGHTILNTVMNEPQKYFKIDFNEPLSKYSQQDDIRCVFDALHGLFTTSKVGETLDYLLSHKNNFSSSEIHEIKGRLADNSYRHRTGLHLVDADKIFTKEGLEIYKSLDNYLTRLYVKYDRLLKDIPYRSKTFVFDYTDFLMHYPLE